MEEVIHPVEEVIHFCGGGYTPCGGGYYTLVILVSALSPNPFFFSSFRDSVGFRLGLWTRA